MTLSLKSLTLNMEIYFLGGYEWKVEHFGPFIDTFLPLILIGVRKHLLSFNLVLDS